MRCTGGQRGQHAGTDDDSGPESLRAQCHQDTDQTRDHQQTRDRFGLGELSAEHIAEKALGLVSARKHATEQVVSAV